MSNISETHLSDGRELFYFDDAPGKDRSAVDERGLPHVVSTSERRWDALAGEWVVIAGHRQTRTFLPPTDQCPLCPTRTEQLNGATHQTEIPASDYDVVVFENRFPSLSTSTPVESSLTGLFHTEPGNGRCEVVCFTSDHNGAFSRLPAARVRTVLDALAQRTEALGRIDGVEYVFSFENRGEEIGVTLSHPHGQIYAYPFVPPRMDRIRQSLRDHHDATGECLQCALLAAEQADGARIVEKGSHFTAYVPFAARWPYEVMIVPHRHVPDLPALDEPELAELSELYPAVLRRFDGLFDTPAPYIAGWQQAPVRQDRDLWHLALQVFSIRRAPGKLKYLAGSESGAAVWINDIAPERAAASLRGETA
ncbi:galactose-1-phosphate uridylyltransferase [Cryptosporangium aurantiacum]|uniref:Galactose-1-phosphate uridylyltransferase n=1 Tax=Cryptosporangium aurantiacum TaxID=134849 RepID=A0A1M7JYX2_9ACTN|nr:galactose-1-phosphate uridylyltransferase [Cryptosporangium aurantiacum]SHM57737.1 UDPglucose--hexose-1-phosphate uridylyltransferase [Cryptosporangium aurantiacum]